MKKITLTMSTQYVQNWGLWEAARELLQNGLDAGGMEVQYLLCGKELNITTPGRTLDVRSLLLGVSEGKREGSIGQFGEGYKLALLVLCRLGLEVVIHNGINEDWTPRLEFNPDFGLDTLNIHITPAAVDFGRYENLTFKVSGIEVSDWDMIQSRWRQERDAAGEILSEPGQVGKIYVGGLYVCTLPAFKKYGYDFQPADLKLNRDRDIPSMFDVLWAAGRMHAAATAAEVVLQDMIDGAAEVVHVGSHINTRRLVAAFERTYVDEVPVASHEEVKRLPEGTAFRLVPQGLRDLLWGVKVWVQRVIHRRPVDRLEELRELIVGRLSDSEIELLDGVIADLKV